MSSQLRGLVLVFVCMTCSMVCAVAGPARVCCWYHGVHKTLACYSTCPSLQQPPFINTTTRCDCCRHPHLGTPRGQGAHRGIGAYAAYPPGGCRHHRPHNPENSRASSHHPCAFWGASSQQHGGHHPPPSCQRTIGGNGRALHQRWRHAVCV